MEDKLGKVLIVDDDVHINWTYRYVFKKWRI